MSKTDVFYRVCLKEALERRMKINSNYSIHAFAYRMNVDADYLAKLMDGEILLSVDIAQEMVRFLKLTGEVRALFLFSAVEEQRKFALKMIDPTLTDSESGGYLMASGSSHVCENKIRYH